MITRPTPHRAVFPVEKDGVDGAGGAFLHLQFVAHFPQGFSRPGWRIFIDEHDAGACFMFAEGSPHLERVDVGRFAGLLHVHAELDDVEEKL